MKVETLDSHSGTSISDLPPELVIDIFHYACILSTSFSLTLCQLSTWTRTLALPYLFSTVVLKNLATSGSFSQALLETPIHPPRPDFNPKKHVTSAWIEAVSNRVLSIFRPCDNIVNLALSVDNLNWLVYASSVAVPSLSMLSARSIARKKDLRLLILNAKKERWSQREYVSDNASLTSPLFAKITHLRIGSIGPYSTHLDLAHFTRLTHIAIPYHQPETQQLPDLNRVFNFPSTVFLVVVLVTDVLSDAQYQDAISWVIQTRVRNSKVYVVASCQPDLQAEWEEEARRGLSIWDKAERFTQNLTS